MKFLSNVANSSFAGPLNMHRNETLCMELEKTIKLDDGRQVSWLVELWGTYT